MGSKKVACFLIPFIFILGCSNEEDQIGAAQDFFSNKAKWNKAKQDLDHYQIIHNRVTWMASHKTTMIFKATNDEIVSCKLEVHDHVSETPTVTDCIDSSYTEQNINHYFSYLADMISSNDIASYTFDNEFGVPTHALGSIVPTCQDCSMSGFTIEFEAFK